MGKNYKIIIIDSGFGNTRAVRNMLFSIGLDSTITIDKTIIKGADYIILPGVGSFDAAMTSIKPLVELIREVALVKKTPILGICLGMQLLGSSSEEGKDEGINLIEGKNIKLSSSPNYKVPHLNWEYLIYKDEESFFSPYETKPKFYFAHSYHFVPKDKSTIIASFPYPNTTAAMIKKDNICGVQFHPEKSHKYGQIFFKKYFELI